MDERGGCGSVGTLIEEGQVDKDGNTTCTSLVGDGRVVDFTGFCQVALELLPLGWGAMSFLDHCY